MDDFLCPLCDLEIARDVLVGHLKGCHYQIKSEAIATERDRIATDLESVAGQMRTEEVRRPIMAVAERIRRMSASRNT